MKNLRNYAIVAIASLLVGRYVLQPAPKEVVKWKEKIVKVEEKQKKVTSRKIKKPDGTVITDTTVQEDTNTVSNTERQGSKSKGSGITLGLLATKNLGDFGKTNAEAIAVVPFFGNLKIVGSVTTQKQVGLGVALEF